MYVVVLGNEPMHVTDQSVGCKALETDIITLALINSIEQKYH